MSKQKKQNLCANFRCSCVTNNHYFKRKTLKVFTLISYRNEEKNVRILCNFWSNSICRFHWFCFRQHSEKSLCSCFDFNLDQNLVFLFLFSSFRNIAAEKKTSHSLNDKFQKSAWQTPNFLNKSQIQNSVAARGMIRESGQTKWKREAKNRKITGTNDRACECECMCDGGLWSFAQPPRIILQSFFSFWFLKFVNLAILKRANVTATATICCRCGRCFGYVRTAKKSVWNKNISMYQIGLSVVCLCHFLCFDFRGDIRWPIAVCARMWFQVDNK